MSPKSNPAINLSLPQVQVKGAGSASTANQYTRALTRGLETAVRDLAAGGRLRNDVHVDRLNIRIPVGASEGQIANAIRQALNKSMPHTGDHHEKP